MSLEQGLRVLEDKKVALTILPGGRVAPAALVISK
jgi:hypothetical protein